MLKVECESCKAPYQIDERRVPAAGLKMRCPKCGHSFVVKNPSAPAEVAKPAPAVGPRVVARPAAPSAAPRPPPLVVKANPAPPIDLADLDLVPPSSAAPAPRAQAPMIQKRTMMGVAGPTSVPPVPPRVVKAPPPPPSNAPVDFNLSIGLGGSDPLGDVSDLPSPAGDLPSLSSPVRPAIRATTKATPAFSPPASIGFGEMDLPSPVDAELPVAARPKGPPAVPTRAGVPAVMPGRQRPPGFSDLPAPVLSDLPAPVLSDLPAPVLSDLPASVLSDLPAAVLSDLPAAANVGLPSPAKVGHPPAAAKAPPALNRPTLGFGEIDLPVAANDLPALASALPSVAQSLPTVAQSLPTVAQSLPTVAQSLPTVAQSLPTVAQSLPTAKVPLGAGSFPPAFGVPPSFGSADDFGELELPRAPPAAARGAKPLDSPAPEIPGFGLDSPAPEHGGPVDSLFDENPFSSVAPPTPGAGVHGAGGELGFGELDIPGPPPERRGTFSDPVPQSERGSVGGMAFGELDLGEGGASSDLPNDNPFGEASLGSVIQPPPTAHDEASRASARPSDFARAEGFAAPTEAQLDSGTTRQKREPRARVAKGPSPVPKILAGLAVVLVLGGTAATFTPAGFFGKDLVNDSMHAAEYAKLAETSVSAVHDGLASDNFGDAEAMADRLAATRAAKPRARALTAVAAIAELETQLRFGKDPERANRAKLWLTDIPAPNSPTKVKYLDVAQTAAAALDRDRDKARAGFDAASRKYAGDPILQDIAFMRGQLELRAGDAAAATTAFKQALALAPGARAHFGLAQAAFLAGDAKTAASELDATIAAAPKHGAALLLRAEVAWSQGRDDSAAELALKDLSTLLEGPAKTSISTGDQSQAYAWRGVIQFARGRSAEARKAFDDALKADERDVTALIGQGDVLYDEGRYTEAISRYETAKQVDPNAVAAITGAAKTEIALERPLDAKTHLIDAVKRFPKSVLALQWLATSEAALGDRKSAEKDFLGAIDLIDPRDPDGIEPYAAYASFLATQGRGDEAQAKLQEAVKKLPDSVVLERTLGDVAVVQGRFDEALQRYHAALSMDARDVSSRFRLGQVLRKTNKIDEASKVFDDVYAADKNYPGLSLERGLLFEQSGDVEKALDQFKSALERAPNDPDLKLRVGASYVAIGQGEKAEPLLKEVGKDRPNSAEADYYLGRALLLQGPMHYQEAMRHLQLAASREANRAEYHLYVGWLANLEMPPDLGLAHKEIEKALALDQTLADAYWQMGVTEFLTAQYDYSIRDLQHALQLKPTLFEVHAWLAQDYDTKNMPDAVVAEWRLALAHEDDKSIDPLEVADWNRRFGTVLNDRGQYAEAAKRLKSAVGVGESSQPRPPWLTRAELAVAEALRKVGDTAGSCTHYASFVQMADQNNPDRRDARKTCRDVCGKPCEISP